MKKIAIIGNKIDNYINAYKLLGVDLIVVDTIVDPNEYDGLIIPGGGDVNPKYYNEDINGSVGINGELDANQLQAIDKFVKAKKPILGICRGMQLLNVYFGGNLIQDIKQKDTHTPSNRQDKTHEIEVTSSNFLKKLYGQKFIVNSHHHQAIKKTADDFEVLAKCNDGIIEAVKHNKLPIIAVQFHPERMVNNLRKPLEADGIKVLEYFLTLLK